MWGYFEDDPMTTFSFDNNVSSDSIKLFVVSFLLHHCCCYVTIISSLILFFSILQWRLQIKFHSFSLTGYLLIY